MTDTNEMVATLRDVVTRLDDLGLAYMVTGSFAMSDYVTARMTMDIDIVIEISAADADRFERRFFGDYYVDARAIRRAGNDLSMFNIINNETLIKIDCIVKKTSRSELAKFTRRRRSLLGGVECWVISKEDLILSKLDWAKESHSEIQFRDVRNLIETGVDDEMLGSEIKDAGLESTWKAFEEWKIRAAK